MIKITFILHQNLFFYYCKVNQRNAALLMQLINKKSIVNYPYTDNVYLMETGFSFNNVLMGSLCGSVR